MDELKRMIEAIGKAFEEFKAANDLRIKEIENGRHDPVLAEKVDKINADITRMGKVKEQLEALETAVARAQFPGGQDAGNNAAVKAHLQAFEKWFKKGGDQAATASLLNDLAVKAQLSTLSDPDGGFITAPPTVEQAIDRVAGMMSAMRRVSSVISINSDTYKKFVNQGGNTHGWVGETQTGSTNRPETDTPTLAEIAINVKEIYSQPATTQTLLDDAIRDIGAWLADEVSIDFAEAEGDGFFNGNGVAQMKGLNAYTKVANASYSWGKIGYITSGHASLLNNADKLMDLELALKSVYLSGASWLMNRSTVTKIRQFKNGEGDYIWRPGLEAGAPNTLLGYPIVTDDNCDAIAANKFPIYFGNFKRGYLVVDRQGVRVIRDNLTEKGKVLFYTTKRVGGGIIMYEAIKGLKIAA